MFRSEENVLEILEALLQKEGYEFIRDRGFSYNYFTSINILKLCPQRISIRFGVPIMVRYIPRIRWNLGEFTWLWMGRITPENKAEIEELKEKMNQALLDGLGGSETTPKPLEEKVAINTDSRRPGPPYWGP